MKESRFYIKKLTTAEVGEARTHEKYIRLPNDFDYKSFFHDSDYDNGSVIQVDFTVIDKTDGCNQLVPMRFVYYANSNHEKRLPSLGVIFDSHCVQANDVVFLESHTVGKQTLFYITFRKPTEADVAPASAYYVIKGEDALTPRIEIPTNESKIPLQQIIYGAPGTGKSFGVDENVKKHNMKDIRTTFHPDSDYSTFVGAYKPQMEKVTVRDDRGFPVKENGQIVYEKKIVYKYTQQAFLKAYVAAWKDLENPHVLVIEEINRGNCAQIFGDLFQLLDRNDNGFSSYPITADTDIMQTLNDEFDGLQIADAVAINAMYKDDVMEDVLSGNKLLLPNNLYIWATMNTSDQSLFPIDSAFKRRWDWKYVPISDAKKNWIVSINGQEYDWWSFVEEINQKIWDATHSEDKKLGYFFCKADRKAKEEDDENTIISADKFVGKVLFYIYNDVFKDYGFDDAIFKDKEANEDLLFHCFFKSDGKPEEKKIQVFMNNLEVQLAADKQAEATDTLDDEDNENNEDGTAPVQSTFKVTLDGEVIEESEQFDTYLAALKKMGMDKVEPIAAEKEYNRYDCPFVSTEQFAAIKEKDNFSYAEADGYQVIKGINKKGMSNFLKICAEKLGHTITIE